MQRQMSYSHRLLTILADLFFLWVLLHFGMGGWETAWPLLQAFGWLGWLLLGMVVFLVLYRSDYRTDLPLFAAGWALGYWGEWWGTTRGVWTYWNGATPPEYLPPLWGIGLLTVYQLAGLFTPRLPQPLPKPARLVFGGSLALFPVLAFAWSWPRLAAVDWSGRLDIHFFLGVAVGLLLLGVRFDLRQIFPLYLGGMLLGGLYETLGTRLGEWRYITGETPPLWIAPLWGLAAAAMARLARVPLLLFQIITKNTKNMKEID